jgi:hypothetical protein
MSDSSGSDHYNQAELLNILRTGSLREQQDALTRLAAVGEADALDAVVEYLRSGPRELRSLAMDTLRVLANKYLPQDRYGLAEAIIPSLAVEEWSQRLIATHLLYVFPNELATDDLRDLLLEARDKAAAEKSTRFSAGRMVIERTLAESILALASCGRLAVLPEMLDMLEDEMIRAVAVRGLGIIGSETERDRMEELAEDADSNVRDSAQWALGLMDERQEMFLNPPQDMPDLPPERLNPVYWVHRQLHASQDELKQFLVVRVAIEHLLLDLFLSENRVPEECTLIMRRHSGDTPPDFRFNRSEVVGAWQYQWAGPGLAALEPETIPNLPIRPGFPLLRSPHILISVPDTLEEQGSGLVGFDCLYGPYLGRGWVYQITRKEGEWMFTLLRRTWSG